MKKIIVFSLMIATLIVSACGNPQQARKTDETGKIEPLKIVTSFYPLYEIANQIGGNAINIVNIVPGGTEPHDYEPTAKDIIAMREADLVLYNGMGLEPWKDKVIPDLQKNGIQTMQMSDFLKESIIANDPHLWLDPVIYLKEVEIISKKMIELDPAHADIYAINTEKFIQKLEKLNVSYGNDLKTCKLNTFVTNHGAFAYLANRYSLNIVPIAGLSPDIEPSPRTMADITNLIKQKNIHYILTETLVSPKIADTLANASGAKTLVLNPLEGLTGKEVSDGKNYISTMEDNLINLKTALECR